MERRRLAGARFAIVVGSGKGGVGKTTVSVSLALALRRLGWRVGLFDADLYGPNVPVMLGVRRRASSPGMVPISRKSENPYIAPLPRYGLDVMSMGFLVGDREALGPDPRFVNRLVLQTLRDVTWDVDVLIIDLPPGTGEPQTSLVREVTLDGALVVTTPGELSMMDAGRSLAALRKDEVPIAGVVENMAFIRCPDCGGEVHLHPMGAGRSTEELLGYPVLARIPATQTAARPIWPGHGLVDPDAEGEADRLFLDLARRTAEWLERAG